MGSKPQQHAWRPGLESLKEGPYSGQPGFGIFQQDMHESQNDRPFTPPSSLISTYVEATPSDPGPSQERELKATQRQSRESESYSNLPIHQASYPGEQLHFQHPVRDGNPYASLSGNLPSEQRRDGSLDMRNNSRHQSYDLLTDKRVSLSGYRKSRSRSPLPLSFQSAVPGSSFSAYRKSRRRSPLALSYHSKVPGSSLPAYMKSRSKSPLALSPYSKEREPLLPNKNLSRQGVPDGSSSRRRSVQSTKKDDRFEDKLEVTGSVVRVDGIPAENKTVWVAKLLDRLGAFGTVTDVRLHCDSESDYALFFYSDALAANAAVQNFQISPFSRSLKLSLWAKAADRDTPVTVSFTRVMYVRDIDKAVSLEVLLQLCAKFGEILDIVLKETSSSFNTAIVQYWDQISAKNAAHSLYLVRIGKSYIRTFSDMNMPSNCVWIDGLPKDLDKRKLIRYFEEYGHIDKYVFDRQRGAALILFPGRVPAKRCVRSLENGTNTLGGQKIRADYANDRAQLAFCKAMEQSGQDVGSFLYA